MKIIKIIKHLRLMLTSDPKKIAYIHKKNGVNMGENCQIYGNVGFGSEPYMITLGNYVKITNGCQFITHDGGIYVLRNMKLLENGDSFGKIIVGNNVFFGNRVIVLPGVTIGDNCVIGAGSVVTKNIPSNSICAGVPAKIIKSIDEYYDKIRQNTVFTKNLSRTEKKKYLLQLGKNKHE